MDRGVLGGVPLLGSRPVPAPPPVCEHVWDFSGLSTTSQKHLIFYCVRCLQPAYWDRAAVLVGPPEPPAEVHPPGEPLPFRRPG